VHFSCDSLERFSAPKGERDRFDLIVEPDYTKEETRAAALYAILPLLLILQLLSDAGWNVSMAEHVAEANNRLVQWMGNWGTTG
jgi:hypothetical protein